MTEGRLMPGSRPERSERPAGPAQPAGRAPAGRTRWRRPAVGGLAALLALAPLPWVLGGGSPSPSGRGSSATTPTTPTTTTPTTTTPSTPATTPPLRSATAWANAFDAQWRRTKTQAQAWAAAGDSSQHYPLAYSVDALTSAYLATGRTAYVTDGLALLTTVADTSRPSAQLPDSRFRDGYRGWSSRLEQDGGDEVALYESYLWRYGTTLLRVVRQDPVLWSRPELRRSYERLLAVAVRDVFDKWWSRGANSYIYRERVHLSAHWALVALNLSLLQDTSDSSGQRWARYAAVVRQFVQGSPADRQPGLRVQLVPSPVDPGAWFWSDVWGSYELPGQDVSHGNAVVTFAVEAHDLGAGLTDDDLRRFGRTLGSVVWPRTGRGTAHVDGSGTGTGWFSDGFVKLGRYDAALQARLETHQPANGQFHAAMALNAAVLGCGRGSSDGPPACRPRRGLLPLDPLVQVR